MWTHCVFIHARPSDIDIIRQDIPDVETSPAHIGYTIDDALNARKVLNILQSVPRYEVALEERGDGRIEKQTRRIHNERKELSNKPAFEGDSKNVKKKKGKQFCVTVLLLLIL
jgi:hypothetical protein